MCLAVVANLEISMDKCREEIGISGMSGRFPECGNLEDFRKKLYDGADMITSDFCRWPDATDDLHNFGGKRNLTFDILQKFNVY